MEEIYTVEISNLLKNLFKKDPVSLLHSYRVADLAVAFAKELSCTEKELRQIRLGALLHDIGKLEVPRKILHKQGSLTPREASLIRKHPEHGTDLLRQYQVSEEIIHMAQFHHERWDGTGYPFGKSQEEIPFQARLLALCDSLEAMTGIRPYRQPVSWTEAMEEIERQSGKQFDPTLARRFLQWMKATRLESSWPAFSPYHSLQQIV